MCGCVRVCMRGAYYNQYLRVFTKYYNIIIHFIVLCIDIKINKKKKGKRRVREHVLLIRPHKCIHDNNM